jgi:hypothetical protein
MAGSIPSGLEVCYTEVMNCDQQVWRHWAARLKKWGIVNLVASLLEALGPLTVVGAQFVYLGQPLLRGVFPEGSLNSAARLLEDPGQVQAFARILREDKTA